MKKSKRFLALATATILSLSSFSTVFAADSDFVKVYEGIGYIVNTAEGKGPDKLEAVYYINGGIAGSTQDEPTVSTGNYGDLKFTERSFYVDDNFILGAYPEINGASALNSKMVKELSKYYERFKSYKSADWVKSIYTNSALNSYFHVSYLVENFNRYAKVSLTITLQENFEDITGKKVELTYYLDKATNAEITESVFNKGIADQKANSDKEEVKEEETETEETVNEDIYLVPVSAVATEIGYEVSWNEKTREVTMTKDDVEVSFVIDEDEYIVDGESYELGVAPTIVDGRTLVPSTFFTDLLEVDLTIDADGYISFG